jgi:hypothetical protein
VNSGAHFVGVARRRNDAVLDDRFFAVDIERACPRGEALDYARVQFPVRAINAAAPLLEEGDGQPFGSERRLVLAFDLDSDTVFYDSLPRLALHARDLEAGSYP